MDTLCFGRSMRAFHLRLDKRQDDVGRDAEVSRQVVSRIESGDIDGMTLGTIRRVADAVGADVQLLARWHGEGLDRLLDAAHAGIVNRVVAMLQDAGWETAVEVSFSLGGERGSVDVVGLRRASAAPSPGAIRPFRRLTDRRASATLRRLRRGTACERRFAGIPPRPRAGRLAASPHVETRDPCQGR